MNSLNTISIGILAALYLALSCRTAVNLVPPPSAAGTQEQIAEQACPAKPVLRNAFVQRRYVAPVKPFTLAGEAALPALRHGTNEPCCDATPCPSVITHSSPHQAVRSDRAPPRII